MTAFEECTYRWKNEYQLSVTGELACFLGSQQKDPQYEHRVRSLIKRFDDAYSKLISLQNSLNIVVQCNKALMISLIYITESQLELCVDLSLCEKLK